MGGRFDVLQVVLLTRASHCGAVTQPSEFFVILGIHALGLERSEGKYCAFIGCIFEGHGDDAASRLPWFGSIESLSVLSGTVLGAFRLCCVPQQAGDVHAVRYVESWDGILVRGVGRDGQERVVVYYDWRYNCAVGECGRLLDRYLEQAGEGRVGGQVDDDLNSLLHHAPLAVADGQPCTDAASAVRLRAQFRVCNLLCDETNAKYVMQHPMAPHGASVCMKDTLFCSITETLYVCAVAKCADGAGASFLCVIPLKDVDDEPLPCVVALHAVPDVIAVYGSYVAYWAGDGIDTVWCMRVGGGPDQLELRDGVVCVEDMDLRGHGEHIAVLVGKPGWRCSKIITLSNLEVIACTDIVSMTFADLPFHRKRVWTCPDVGCKQLSCGSTIVKRDTVSHAVVHCPVLMLSSPRRCYLCSVGSCLLPGQITLMGCHDVRTVELSHVRFRIHSWEEPMDSVYVAGMNIFCMNEKGMTIIGLLSLPFDVVMVGGQLVSRFSETAFHLCAAWMLPMREPYAFVTNMDIFRGSRVSHVFCHGPMITFVLQDDSSLSSAVIPSLTSLEMSASRTGLPFGASAQRRFFVCYSKTAHDFIGSDRLVLQAASDPLVTDRTLVDATFMLRTALLVLSGSSPERARTVQENCLVPARLISAVAPDSLAKFVACVMSVGSPDGSRHVGLVLDHLTRDPTVSDGDDGGSISGDTDSTDNPLARILGRSFEFMTISARLMWAAVVGYDVRCPDMVLRLLHVSECIARGDQTIGGWCDRVAVRMAVAFLKWRQRSPSQMMDGHKEGECSYEMLAQGGWWSDYMKHCDEAGAGSDHIVVDPNVVMCYVKQDPLWLGAKLAEWLPSFIVGTPREKLPKWVRGWVDGTAGHILSFVQPQLLSSSLDMETCACVLVTILSLVAETRILTPTIVRVVNRYFQSMYHTLHLDQDSMEGGSCKNDESVECQMGACSDDTCDIILAVMASDCVLDMPESRPFCDVIAFPSEVRCRDDKSFALLFLLPLFYVYRRYYAGILSAAGTECATRCQVDAIWTAGDVAMRLHTPFTLLARLCATLSGPWVDHEAIFSAFDALCECFRGKNGHMPMQGSASGHVAGHVADVLETVVHTPVAPERLAMQCFEAVVVRGSIWDLRRQRLEECIRKANIVEC